jgi:hypothetical protein
MQDLRQAFGDNAIKYVGDRSWSGNLWNAFLPEG